MTSEVVTVENPKTKKSFANTAAYRLLKYSGIKLLILFATVVVGVYLTILIANMGGYVDQIMKSEIKERFSGMIMNNKAYEHMSTDQRKEILAEMIAQEEERIGLNTPFVVRSFNYLGNALQLKLGRAIYMTSDTGSKTVKNIILDRLPATLLLMGTADLLLFFSALFFALVLSRHYGSFWDKFVIAMSPTSSAPPWFYGIFLILIFAAVLKVLPFGGMIDAPPPATKIGYALNLLKHIILPGGSLVISQLFLSIYTQRTFFLIYSSEDYVEMAKAKGLPARDIENRYILRPTLPTIITSFALLVIGLWTGAMITETVFLWPGLGRTMYTAIGLYDTPVIVGTTIIYAYLLAITVFLLEFLYALVDPRVKIGN